ncbi:hypothetical protein [Ornithinimicrobium sediminis]|uniref:hypothetical protein n=1 Tax=Ornithinimicrobium sediminis TaxID=2904603 RepID=UPI001E43C3A1|nr:hypothetical protein [Ornithinimicrobium sediminis]MCE0488337.1 hypothetical protein [Ornithinimicrobium sediminis]
MSDMPASGPVPTTGDAEVDRILADFDAAVQGEEHAQVEAVGQALARLQARLSSSS